MIYELLIMIIGWLYPAFATYNTLNGNLRTQLPWMKYWIVFGVFNAFHFFTICMEPYVPFLSGFKVLVLCWLLPSIGCGSQLIHDEVVDPLLTNNRETINQAVDRISRVSSTLMRELIKMIYHLMVDVVEQFWLMTRNANDINVTPRLQMAINEAILDEYHELEQLEEDGEPLPIADTPGAFQAAAFDALPNDPSSLSVLLAESREAKHLQLLQLVNGQMHLVSSKQTFGESEAAAMPQRPLKPKRGKRKSLEAAAQRAQQLQLEMEVERAYQEYCAAAQEHEQRGGEKVAEQH